MRRTLLAVSTQAARRGQHIATCVVLGAIGVMLGVIEAFLVPLRIFGGVEGLSVVLAFGGNLVVGSLGGIGTRTIRAAVIPVVTWFLTVAAITVYAPGGDVVLPGQLKTDPGVVVVTTLFLILGLLGGGLALVMTVIATARAIKSPSPATPSG